MSEQSHAGVRAAAVVLGLAAAGSWIGYGWLGHGAYKIALLLLPFVAGKRPGYPEFRGTGWRASALSGILLGLLASGSLLLLLPLVADPATIRAALDARYGFTPATAIAASAFLLSANALLEEWFYRGFLDRELGPLVSSIVFGLQHTAVLWGVAGPAGGILAGVGCFAAGMIWGRLAVDGLSRPLLSHALADLLLLGTGLAMLGYLG